MTGLCIWAVVLTRRASLTGSGPQGVAEAPGR